MMQSVEYASLSARQTEIAQMIVNGKSTREIALALTLSPRTIESHIAAIYNKYGVSSRPELILAVLGSGARSGENQAPDAPPGKTNLPARRWQLLGRAKDVAIIIELIRESRLVTLTGAGGVGKTRAALAVGEALVDDFKAGVWLVELASLARGSSVAEAVARALNIEPSGGVAPTESLSRYLRQKSLVLVLDNCEHLVTDVAAVADALLRDCPQIRVLATSREPLRIAGERTYRLPSLPVPSTADALAADASLRTAYASIELFMQRAQAVDFAFTPSRENLSFVAQICRRVDGIPLAIELAAARVNILPVNALATKLESHLRILGGGDRIALPRHQTMHALIDWSYELLKPSEQRLFERLSIFSGGCALSEVVAVYGDDSVGDVSVLEMLSSLVEKSLVIAHATTPPGRFGLLQTFAQYGAEKLAARGETAQVARLHAVAYVTLAERLEAEYDAAPSTAWLARAQCEVANWHAVLEWALTVRHDVVLSQRLVAAMRPIWKHAEGGQRWLRLAQDLIDERTPATVAAAVRFASTSLKDDFGEHEQTVADCRQLRPIYERFGDPFRVVQLETWEGTALFLLGRVDEAEPLLASALAAYRKTGAMAQIAYLLNIMVQVSFRRGDLADGRVKSAEAVSIFESMGAQRGAAMVRVNLADAEFSCGNIDAAIQLGTSNLIAVRHVGLTRDIARCLVNLAGYCIAADHWTAARGYAREALKVLTERQQQLFFDALQHVAAIAVLAPADADRSAQRSRGVRLFGYADERSRVFGYSRESNEQREYDRILAALRETHAPDALAALMANGAALDSNQAIELAQSM